VHILEQAFDIFWLTSKPRSEGVPTAVNEAMALSLPVVSYNAGMVSEILRHKKNGIIIDDFNPETLASETEKLLQDEQLLCKIKKEARKTAEDRLSISECVKNHIKAFTIALKK
jgi:glycosyltransferase involved in cell wall biosynthesis